MFTLPFCRSLGRIGRAAALEHLLRGVRLGWEFTPTSPIVSPATPSTTHGVSNGHPKDGQQAERMGEGVAGRKPTLLLLHGFMGSKVTCRSSRGCNRVEIVMIEGVLWVGSGVVSEGLSLMS